MVNSSLPFGVAASSASLPTMLAMLSCSSWYSVISTQLVGKLISGTLSFSSSMVMLQGKKGLVIFIYLSPFPYLQDLLEGIATLAG